MRALLIGSLCLLAVACDYDYDALRGPRRDGGADAGPTAPDDPLSACASAVSCESLAVGIDEVDLLFVVDNSNSMNEEQIAFTRELPTLVRALAAGDSNGNGERDFTPITSLHIGVVTSDMGSGGHTTATCGNGSGGFALGDDGLLRTQGRTAIAGCSSSYPSILEFNRGASDPDAYATDLACVATVGTGGCGFEQQLDAMLKAISPSSAQSWTRAGFSAPTFPSGGSGHASEANAGFVRDGSILAVVMLTDEEDCSALDPNIFDLMSPTYGAADLNLRCFTFPLALQPVERFVEGLLQLRQDPEHLVYVPITGVPPELSGMSADTILASPDMIEEIDPGTPTRLIPSCNRGGNLAFPPRRIVSVGRGLQLAGAQVSQQSICQDSFAEPMAAVVRGVADAVGVECLQRSHARNLRTMLIGCRVLETLPQGATCAARASEGRTLVGTRRVGAAVREVCEVQQLPLVSGSVDGPGWAYETLSNRRTGSGIRMECPEGANPGRIWFTAPPQAGAVATLLCDN